MLKATCVACPGPSVQRTGSADVQREGELEPGLKGGLGRGEGSRPPDRSAGLVLGMIGEGVGMKYEGGVTVQGVWGSRLSRCRRLKGPLKYDGRGQGGGPRRADREGGPDTRVPSFSGVPSRG